MLNRRRAVNLGVNLDFFRRNRQRRSDGGSPEPGVAGSSSTQKINHFLKLIHGHIRHHFNLHRRLLPALGRLMLLLRQQPDKRLNALKPRRRLLHHRTLLQLLHKAEITIPTVTTVPVIHHKLHCHGRRERKKKKRQQRKCNKGQNDAIGEAKEKKKG